MDILRKELNDIYYSQHLEKEMLDMHDVEVAKNRAGTLAQLTGGCAVVTDAYCDHCYIFSGGFGKVMDYSDNLSSCFETDSSDEDIIYSLIHPEDIVDKRLLEYEFFKLMCGKTPEEKRNYIAGCRLRMKNGKGEYRSVENTTQLLTLSPRNKIWLILCTYNYATGKAFEAGINPTILDTSTGEITCLSLGEKRKTILTEREKTILNLIKEGKSSKMIADFLGISVHTVNRHRQNIIEKLSVGNSIEAVTAASLMNLL